MNRNDEKKTRRPNPIVKASFLSKFTYWWLNPILKIGLKRTIQDDDIYTVTEHMQSARNTDAYIKQWMRELEQQNPSILRVIFKLHLYKLMIFAFLFASLETVARCMVTICLGGLLTYFAQLSATDQTYTLGDAHLFATGIVFANFSTLAAFNVYIFYATNTAYKVRTGCSGLIYDKALRILLSCAKDGQNGHIINLLSTDMNKLEAPLTNTQDLYQGPLQVVVFTILIYMEIGISGVFGVLILLCSVPLQVWIGRQSALLREKCAERTDVRIKIMNEIIYGVQVIKMYAWEKSFGKIVDAIRKKEVAAIRSIAYVQTNARSMGVISKLALFLALFSYILYDHMITARKVFIVSSYFGILEFNMLLYWTESISAYGEAYATIKRLNKFLLSSETKKSAKRIPGMRSTELTQRIIPNRNNVGRVQSIDVAEKCIRFENATAIWACEQNAAQENGIYDVSIEMKAGLCGIVGAVGAGKSTLLNVILGELELDSGALTINGTISYASQDPWLFSGTIRNNIVFVDEFDEQRYNAVVKVCALKDDFRQLPHGDRTIVGEKGISLSGGQKARVNLARAIYKRSDIYLLDDPLSAVDTHVGQHIFEQCIQVFLADKICVLVTHQLQYFKNVHHIVLLTSGRVEAERSFHMLQIFNKYSLMHAAQDDFEPNADDFEPKNVSRQSSRTSFDDEDFDEIEINLNDRKERQLDGSVQFSTYKNFFRAMHSNGYVLTVFTLFAVSQAIWSGADYYLSVWINSEEYAAKMISDQQQNNSSTFDTFDSRSLENRYAHHENRITAERKMYTIIYACLLGIGIIFYIIRTIAFYQMCLRISINLHDLIYRGVIRAKMIFFNNNPSGRILNRFARDINNVDSMLPNAMYDVITCFLQYLAVVIITVIINPWILIPATILTALLYLLRSLYINTGRSFRRLEALSRSPVFSNVNATLQGLSTIRAFNAKKILVAEFHELQNYNTSCWYLSNAASRWFGLWLDVVSHLFSACVTFSFLLLPNTAASGQIGLAILNSLYLIDYAQSGMRQSAELENQMTSVERIFEYGEIPAEPPLESQIKNAPPNGWPQFGKIEFKSLSLCYAEKGKRILQNLTFRIDAKQKIGIVGRTGAGKSSIIQALFRLAENEGQIFVDGIDVGVIGLHDLRSKISIIPQEAILFSGSLRFNLDPFDESSDDELWHSLDLVELKAFVSTIPGALDCNVKDGGSNFSAGQRQLLCLARAILRKNQILILDEATANVDSDTDHLIQQTIRRQFSNCTVLTIAHRLNTIMDSDLVLVVDAGAIVEFDHPYVLIQKSNGYFRQLLDQCGHSTAKALSAAAKESFERRTEEAFAQRYLV